jgi:hypothetical protein
MKRGKNREEIKEVRRQKGGINAATIATCDNCLFTNSRS